MARPIRIELLNQTALYEKWDAVTQTYAVATTLENVRYHDADKLIYDNNGNELKGTTLMWIDRTYSTSVLLDYQDQITLFPGEPEESTKKVVDKGIKYTTKIHHQKVILQ